MADEVITQLDVDAPDARGLGVALARRHEQDEPAGPSLHEFPERVHANGWSMRAALVRYAQPEPVRAAAVLDLVRRTGAGLDRWARAIEHDHRLSDLARAHARWPDDFGAVLDGYGTVVEPPADDALDAVALLAVAATLDDIGAVMASWAARRRDTRPDDAVDVGCRAVDAALDRLGVERQDWYA